MSSYQTGWRTWFVFVGALLIPVTIAAGMAYANGARIDRVEQRTCDIEGQLDRIEGVVNELRDMLLRERGAGLGVTSDFVRGDDGDSN